MKDFIFAAIPWVLMGLALCLFFANMAKRKKQEGKNDLYGVWIALGAAIGIAAGSALEDVDLCCGIGMLIGSVIDVIGSKK